MPEEMHGDEPPASPEPSEGTPSDGAQLSTAEAEPVFETPRVLSNTAREQLARAKEQGGLHVGRMAKKAGRTMAEDMWQEILVGLHSRLLNGGPVEQLDSYLNRCVTNQLGKLRAAIEVLVGDEDLDFLYQQGLDDPQVGSVLLFNLELVEAVKGIRESGVLSKLEADVYVLAQVLGENNRVVAEWVDPPTTAARVASTKYRAVRKVNNAWRKGKFSHLGYEPPRGRAED